ncbi:hypothetical protein NQ317_019722, partial [Molorchus minor]
LLLLQSAKHIIENMCSQYAKDMLAFFLNEEQPEIVLKIAVLFSHFNLTKHFSWNALFDNWKVDDEIVQ